MAAPAREVVELPRRRTALRAAVVALRPRQWSKNLLVDVLAIGGLFVIRAAAGAEAVDVRISPWLLLCTALLALFLALAKRRGELVLVGARETPGRPVLEGYSLELVDQLVSVVAASTVIAYSLYTFTARDSKALMVTIPFVIFGVFRYLLLVRRFWIFVAGLKMTINPAKLGELIKCGLLRRSFGVPVRRSAPVVFAERVTDATGVIVLAVIGGAGTDRWPLLVVALAGVVAAVAVIRSPLLERFAVLGEAPEAARVLLTMPLLAAMTGVSAVSWFFECLAAYVCVRGLDLGLSLADTIVVFSLGSL